MPNTTETNYEKNAKIQRANVFSFPIALTAITRNIARKLNARVFAMRFAANDGVTTRNKIRNFSPKRSSGFKNPAQGPKENPRLNQGIQKFPPKSHKNIPTYPNRN